MNKYTFVESEYYVSGTEARTSSSRALKKRSRLPKPSPSLKTLSRGSPRNHHYTLAHMLLSAFSDTPLGPLRYLRINLNLLDPKKKAEHLCPASHFRRSGLLLKPITLVTTTSALNLVIRPQARQLHHNLSSLRNLHSL